MKHYAFTCEAPSQVLNSIWSIWLKSVIRVFTCLFVNRCLLSSMRPITEKYCDVILQDGRIYNRMWPSKEQSAGKHGNRLRRRGLRWGRDSGVAKPEIGGGLKNFWAAKMFDFRRITLFCLEKRFSKHKMTIFSKHVGGHGPFDTPWLRPWAVTPPTIFVSGQNNLKHATIYESWFGKY